MHGHIAATCRRMCMQFVVKRNLWEIVATELVRTAREELHIVVAGRATFSVVIRRADVGEETAVREAGGRLLANCELSMIIPPHDNLSWGGNRQCMNDGAPPTALLFIIKFIFALKFPLFRS